MKAHTVVTEKSIPPHNTQVIEKNGKPEYIVIPYVEYLKFLDEKTLSNELIAFKDSLSKGDEEFIDEEFATRLINGENPIRVWREYRKISQKDLALKAEISAPYLSQIENNEREPSLNTAKKLAEILKVSLDDLV